jgi:tryptophan 2,3-dioxygenase
VIHPVIEHAELVRELETWGSAEREFPYEAVLSCYAAMGKHFVPSSVVAAIAAVRDGLTPAIDPGPDRRLLDKFLAIALDKWDGTYSYLTYTGIDFLGLTPDADGQTGERQRDEWVPLLLADIWAFERGALDGSHDRLPLRRPDSELVERRLRAVSALMAAGEENEDAVDAVARELLAAATPEQRRALAFSMQPVYIAHDEYLFIRVLESYEVTFAAMAAQIRDAIDAVWTGRAEDAAKSVRKCADLLGSARRLFTLMATMQVASFRDFRTYTVGASAIQSGNYKTFEALCSPPVRSRMESPAYDAVPQIRDRVRNDWIDLTTAVVSATGDGRIDDAGLALIRSSAVELEDVHQRWKQTHWKLAIRMIGEEKGTGYTVGVPYLKGVIDNRLFAQLTGGSHAD